MLDQMNSYQDLSQQGPDADQQLDNSSHHSVGPNQQDLQNTANFGDDQLFLSGSQIKEGGLTSSKLSRQAAESGQGSRIQGEGNSFN